MTPGTTPDPMPSGAGAHREPRRAEVTRARLVEAATEAFAEVGYHATTTRDIAARAGMSPAALYVHHSSKEDLLHEIARQGHQLVLDTLAQAHGISDPVEELRVAARAFAMFHAERHTSARVINYELAALTPEHLAEIVELRRSVEKEFRSIVQRGMNAGVFTVTDPFMPALAITSMGIDVARWYQPGGMSPETIGDSYAEIALRIVGAH